MSYLDRWYPKMLMEWLNSQSVHAPDALTRDKINELASLLQLHRPVKSNGKHDDLHTPTCGCEDSAHARDDIPALLAAVRERDNTIARARALLIEYIGDGRGAPETARRVLAVLEGNERL